MISVLMPVLVFVLISWFLPGFKVSGSKLNYIWLTLGYIVLMVIGKLFLLTPVNTILGCIPFIGGMVTGVAGFVVTFVLSVIMLLVLDAFMDDFKLSGFMVAVKASVLLAVASFIGYLPSMS